MNTKKASPSRHYVLRVPRQNKQLEVEVDIFNRPMLWSIWLKAMFSGNAEWKLVFLPEQEHLEDMAWEDGDVIMGNRIIRPETPTLIHAVIWAVESVLYKTSLKFWQWREFKGLRQVAA